MDASPDLAVLLGRRRRCGDQVPVLGHGADANSGYFWTPGNAHHAANTTIEVAASDLANVWVRGGTSAGSETMWVRAFDGTDWSDWDRSR